MPNTTTVEYFAAYDLALGEARVRNYFTGALIMSVNVHGLQMDAAAARVFASMRRELDPDMVCSVEIDQAPYSSDIEAHDEDAAHEREAEAAQQGVDYHAIPYE